MPAHILSFDTSAQSCSVALSAGGEITALNAVAPRQQTALLLPMIEQLLAESGVARGQLDAIAFGCGPGSFVGVRLAASAAQGLCFALDIPALPISTLLALAEAAACTIGATHVLPCLDARMQEVYWSAVIKEAGQWQVHQPEQVTAPERLCASGLGAHWHLVGPGAAAYAVLAEQTTWSACTTLVPDARFIAQLADTAFASGQGVPAEAALPVYVRNQVTR